VLRSERGPCGGRDVGWRDAWCWLLLGIAGLISPVCAASEEGYPAVLVADPYLELHTGPGRGFPVFYVVERGQRVEILKRRTDWFKVRTENGKEGWGSREQMERTLTEAGVGTTFRDVLYEDYLARRLEFGFSVGQIDSDDILTGFVGYRLIENLSVELSLASTVNDTSTTNLAYISVVSHPFPDWRYSPYLSIGYGQFKYEPKSTLINADDINEDMAVAGIGMRAYITRRFFARIDYRKHVLLVSSDQTKDYDEYSVGLGFFF